MPSSCIVVLTTLPSLSQAHRISEQILKKRLAACVNVVGPVRSFFWWKGKIDRTSEHLLLIKTRASRFSRLRRFLERVHPYSVPEILALPIKAGNAPYLNWLRREVPS